MTEIYPFMDPQELEEVQTGPPPCTEFAYDFPTRQFLSKNGKNYLVKDKNMETLYDGKAKACNLS